MWMKRVRYAVLLTTALGITACKFDVDSMADAPDADPGDRECAAANGTCTLRAAIEEANAAFGRFTIHVPAGTYDLDLPIASGGGSLHITSSIKILGVGAGTTVINQTEEDSVFRVSGGTVEINNLTITGGDLQAGGGIHQEDGTLSLAYVSIEDNFAFTGGGGIFVGEDAEAFIRRSSIIGNVAIGAFGGGVWNQGTLWIYESAINDNESNRAGGIRNSGNMNLRSSTVSGNTANSPDAGVGGISQNGFSVLNNVTVTDNSGRGNNTGSFRGGGIQTTSGTTVMKNSIVAGNFGNGGPNDCVGPLTPDSKYNLIGDDTGCSITSFVSTYLLDVDAGLAVLGDNGGPSETHATFFSSLAREAAYQFPPPAVDACERYDQRGVPRPQGGNGQASRCDMGAYEWTPSGAFVTGLVLVDAGADVDIRPLVYGDRLDLSELPPQLSVRAVVSGFAESVTFDYDGADDFRTENLPPYALNGDAGGDYAPLAISPGEHTITAVPFTLDGGGTGGGAAGGGITVPFVAVQ